jgi:hypothetical protein
LEEKTTRLPAEPNDKRFSSAVSIKSMQFVQSMMLSGLPKPSELIWLQKTAESLRTTTCQMNGRLCDSSTRSGKKPKICHIARHFIKVPQTMASDGDQHHGLDQFLRLRAYNPLSTRSCQRG